MASRMDGHRYPYCARYPFKLQGYWSVGITRIHLGQDGNNVVPNLINNVRRVIISNVVLPSVVLIYVVGIKKSGQFPKFIVPSSGILYAVIDSSRHSYFSAGRELIVDIRAAWTY